MGHEDAGGAGWDHAANTRFRLGASAQLQYTTDSDGYCAELDAWIFRDTDTAELVLIPTDDDQAGRGQDHAGAIEQANRELSAGFELGPDGVERAIITRRD